MKKKGESRVFVFRVINDAYEGKKGGNGRIRLLYLQWHFFFPPVF
jgi:hypothetical protein